MSPTPHRTTRILLAFVTAIALLGAGLTIAAAGPAVASNPTATIDDATTGTGTNQFDYSGTWGLDTNAGYYNNTHHYSNSTSASLAVRFTGTQIALYGGTGTGAGIANVSIDGGTVYQVDFYSAATAGNVQLWVSPTLPVGAHTLTVTPSGLKSNAATGTYVVPDRVDVIDTSTAVDDRATGTGTNQFDYAGTWATNGATGYYNNTHTYTNTTGATATFRFTGAAAHVYGGTGAAGGLADLSLDGGPAQRVDFYSASDAGNVFLWNSGPLASGAHTLTIKVVGAHSSPSTGNWISPDRIDVLSSVTSLTLATSTTSTSTGWGKVDRSPVLGKSYGTAFDISVLRENGIYRMWFSWRPQNSIGYVQSVDGVNWTAPISVLTPSQSWEGIINRPSVIRTADGTYRMWYTGQTNTASAIGYATSLDGVSWTRQSTSPVLTATATWEQTNVMNPSVLYDAASSSYKMWFSGGEQYEPNAIGYASSTNGITWTKSTSNPVLQKNTASTWEQDRVAGIQVIKQNDGYYYAFYIGYANIDTAAIGIARSSDGITGWTRMPTNPIITRTSGAWDCDATYKPYVIWEPDTNQWKLWYNGRCGAPEQIGVATHPGSGLGF